jgi:hypothetical protein
LVELHPVHDVLQLGAVLLGVFFQLGGCLVFVAEAVTFRGQRLTDYFVPSISFFEFFLAHAPGEHRCHLHLASDPSRIDILALMKGRRARDDA